MDKGNQQSDSQTYTKSVQTIKQCLPFHACVVYSCRNCHRATMIQMFLGSFHEMRRNDGIRFGGGFYLLYKTQVCATI